ncbi:MAG: hypothetical protein IK130_12480 [Oscillospiraceae bacterium]|nr:hypothetical protein [Oscillospiraceae bacterium]
MKKFLKKVSAIAMALTLVGTANVFSINSGNDQNNMIVASAASINQKPGYSPHHCGEHMVYVLNPWGCSKYQVCYDRKCSVCGQVYGYKFVNVFGGVMYG